MQHILTGVSPDGTFVGAAVLSWTISVSTVGLIIFPKMWKVRQMHLKAESQEAQPGSAEASGRDRATAPALAPTRAADSAASPVLVSSGSRIQMVTFD